MTLILSDAHSQFNKKKISRQTINRTRITKRICLNEHKAFKVKFGRKKCILFKRIKHLHVPPLEQAARGEPPLLPSYATKKWDRFRSERLLIDIWPKKLTET